MLRAINRVHIGWQQQSLMYINEHIYVYKKERAKFIVIQKIVEVYGSTGTISHFGECLRGGQYTFW